MTDSVAVIIAAKDAETTIGTAVASALAADEVTEVMVVDDASTDQTAAAANDAAGGDPRLRILRQEVNSGPASARNRAVEESTAPVLAILDADDAVLPGRFGHLLSLPGWDLVADNIVFLPEDGFDTRSSDWPTDEGARELSLAAFVAGNISRPGAQRGELGFLKPLIRRAFLDRHRLRYDDALRLGEDYDLYVRALMAGARFRLSHRVGYCARIREASLSGRHGTADLAALSEATTVHLSSVAAGDPAFALLRRQNRDIRRRYLLRACLDAKATGGLPAALRFALVPPVRFLPILRGVAADKIAAARGAQPATVDARVLLSSGG